MQKTRKSLLNVTKTASLAFPPVGCYRNKCGSLDEPGFPPADASLRSQPQSACFTVSGKHTQKKEEEKKPGVLILQNKLDAFCVCPVQQSESVKCVARSYGESTRHRVRMRFKVTKTE